MHTAAAPVAALVARPTRRDRFWTVVTAIEGPLLFGPSHGFW